MKIDNQASGQEPGPWRIQDANLVVFERCFVQHPHADRPDDMYPGNVEEWKDFALCRVFEKMQAQMMSENPSVYEVNGICVPRFPQNAKFQSEGGYSMYLHHAHDEYLFAGYGVHGPSPPSHAQTVDHNFTVADYRQMRYVKYETVNGGNSQYYTKLRNLKVELLDPAIKGPYVSPSALKSLAGMLQRKFWKNVRKPAPYSGEFGSLMFASILQPHATQPYQAEHSMGVSGGPRVIESLVTIPCNGLVSI